MHACGVCRTDLHVVDGELTEPKLPLVPGHQIVGTGCGAGARGRRAGRRAVAGLHLRQCRDCTAAAKPLRLAGFTGYQLDGGYAEAAWPTALLFPLPDAYHDCRRRRSSARG